MPSDETPDQPPKDRKNPWGRPDNAPRGPLGSGGPNRSGPQGGGSGGPPPDLDALFQKLQEAFTKSFKGYSGGYFVLSAVLAVLTGLWFLSGLYVVNPGEYGVLQRFGAWSHTKTAPGLGYHLPAPFETVTLVNVEEIRKLNIGFTDGTGRNEALERQDLPEESLILTSDRNIVDLNLEVQWNIKSAEDFLFEIQDQEATIKKVAESAIREIVGQTNMFSIITNQRQQVADRTKAIIQKNLDEYKSGVNITQVLIQKAEVHPDVQDAFQDVQSAKQDAEDVQNQARAYREDILPKARGRAIQMVQEAEGYAQSTVSKAKGDASRFNSIYEAYLGGKDVTRERIFIETMEDVLKNAQKIILEGEGGKAVVPYLPLETLGPKTPAETASPPKEVQNTLQ